MDRGDTPQQVGPDMHFALSNVQFNAGFQIYYIT